MRAISAENNAALQARRLVARDFLWLKVRTLDTGLPFEYGFWNDVGNVSAQVLDPNTGVAVSRNFEGSGTLISVADIPLTADLAAQSVSIVMSQIDEGVANIVRGYELKQAGVEIYRGMFNPDTRQMVAPAFCRFLGFVDVATITTPKEGEAGGVELTCVSHSQELGRSNPDTRSHDSQLLRSATDSFYKDTTTVGDWQFFWGRKSGKIETSPAQRISRQYQGCQSMIRKAIASDRARVLCMAKAFHEASGIPIPFSAAAASVLFDAALTDPERLCLVYEHDGIARGVLAAIAAPHHLAPVKVASEIIWWVEPAWRGRCAMKMLASYEGWAAQRGCQYVSMVGLGADPAVSKLYARRGYQPVERHFMMPL